MRVGTQKHWERRRKNGWKRPPCSEETKKRLSKGISKAWTPEMKTKKSEEMKGLKWSAERKEMARETRRLNKLKKIAEDNNHGNSGP